MNFLYGCVLAWRFTKSFYGTKKPVRCLHLTGFFYVELKRLSTATAANGIAIRRLTDFNFMKRFQII